MADSINAVTWLRDKLISPQFISSLIGQWVGPLDKATGRTIAELMEARWTLGVTASVDADGHFVWMLPAERQTARH